MNTDHTRVTPGFMVMLLGMVAIPPVADIVFFAPPGYFVVLLQYTYAFACGLFWGQALRRSP